MKHPWIISLTFVILTACFEGAAAQSTLWAIGDRLHITGTLLNWTLGHQIPPTEATFFGLMFIGEDDTEGEDIAMGRVQSGGHFEFVGFCSQPNVVCGNTMPVEDALCAGLRVSDPQLHMSIIDSINIEGIPRGDAELPPRPSGWVVISTERPRNLEVFFHGLTYTYIYADRNASISGSCTFSGAIDLNLRKGWNSVERNHNVGVYKTAAIPADARWWFLNAYTMEQ